MSREELVAAMAAVLKRHGRALLDGNPKRVALVHDELADVAEAHKAGKPAPERGAGPKAVA